MPARRPCCLSGARVESGGGIEANVRGWYGARARVTSWPCLVAVVVVVSVGNCPRRNRFRQTRVPLLVESIVAKAVCMASCLVVAYVLGVEHVYV